MKKIGILIVLCSLGMFTVGCNKPASSGSSGTTTTTSSSTTTTPADTTTTATPDKGK
ncbi:MAG TPA: hypothetical protein VGY55_02450 [Pirellulales bacterium]|nr:hypothetical protein [Pirellulales bacterium]